VDLRVLPDEAAHSQYEMRSFVRSDSGVLYPTGQGRLADPSNPAPSNSVANVTPPISVPGNVGTGVLPRPVIPKSTKEKSRVRSGAAKGGRGVAGHPILAVIEPPSAVVGGADRPIVSTPKENKKARQSRLNAYDDAIESVLRKVQETVTEADNVLYDEIVSDFGGAEEEAFVPPPVAVAPVAGIDYDDRQAQIADTIDAVIARTFHHDESDQSQPSPPALPVGSPPPYDEDEDEVIEVHSVSPLKVEVTTDDILILPPPSPPAPPIRTLAERKFVPEEMAPAPAPRRSKKSKTKPVVSALPKDDDFEQDQPRPLSPAPDELPGPSNLGGTFESYVRLEELEPSARKARPTKDDHEDGVEIRDSLDEGSQLLPLDAAESLMKLAGVAPPPKRLRIAYGLGRDRTVEDSRDSGEMELRTTSDLGPDDLDIGEGGRRSADLLILDHRQRSARDERVKSRAQDLSEEMTEAHDLSVEIAETRPVKPAGKRGRPRKDNKKREKVQKATVIIYLLSGDIQNSIRWLSLFFNSDVNKAG